MIALQHRGWLAVVSLFFVGSLSQEAKANTTTGKELVVISSTSCGPCNTLIKELDDVQRLFDKIGVTVKILDREKNATEIAALASLPSGKAHFPIEHYPMLLAVVNGEVVHRLYGYGKPDDLFMIMRSAFTKN